MIYRLKTRLALANFKRQYGYERYDLHTLESNLFIKSNDKKKKKIMKHRYYPIVQQTHTHTKSYQLNMVNQQSLYPLSEKRSTSPRQSHATIIPTDEDAANVLVMLHNYIS